MQNPARKIILKQALKNQQQQQQQQWPNESVNAKAFIIFS